jgi:hypothetical protein
MAPLFALRLTLDLAAAGLLLFGLSYWWLGNVAHEIAGTGILLLVLLHNGFNRRWYGTAIRTRTDAARLFSVCATLVLAAAMLLLLATSAMITNALPDWLPSGPAFTARQAHVLAAYWAFVAVAIHLGLRWPLIMGIARRLLGIGQLSRWRTFGLRLVTVGIAIQGVLSFHALGLGARLTMQVSLDWWDFEAAVLGFFLHCIAVAGMLIAVSHYIAQMLRGGRPASTPAVAQGLDQQRQRR